MTTEADRLALKLKAKYPLLQYFTDRTFGVEIEFFGLQYVAIPTNNGIIKPYNISSRAKDGQHFLDLIKDYNFLLGDDRETWHFETDGSVRGQGHTRSGAELTSPIVSPVAACGNAAYAVDATGVLNVFRLPELTKAESPVRHVARSSRQRLSLT